AEILGYERQVDAPPRTVAHFAGKHVREDAEGTLATIGNGDVGATDLPAVTLREEGGEMFTHVVVTEWSLVTADQTLALCCVFDESLEMAMADGLGFGD